MATRLTGFPAVNDPRDAPRATQESIRNIRERLRLIEAALNATAVAVSAASAATAPTTSEAAGVNGAVQYNVDGALAGSPFLTFDEATGRLSVNGPANLQRAADAPQDSDVWVDAGLYAYIDGVTRGPFLDFDALVAGDNITIAQGTGDTVIISAGAGALTILVDSDGDVLSDDDGNVLTE